MNRNSMYYSFQINGDENRMGGGESSINSVERREGGKGGRGRKREHWDQREGDLPKGTQQVRGQARTKVLFPQNRMPPPLSPQADYRSRSPNPAFPASAQEARGEVYDGNALINRRKE